MKRWLSVLLVFLILLNLTGCDAIRKKFTPKTKKPTKIPRIIQVKKYEKKPSPELYKKHYAYWASWHSELIKVLGRNHKKDMRCIEEIVGQLNDMQGILVQEKADELQPHIDRIVRVKDIIFKEELTQFNEDYVRRTLDREERFIKREFSVNKVKDYIRISFDDEPEPEN